MVKENVLKKSSNISSMIEGRHAGRNVKHIHQPGFFRVVTSPESKALLKVP